MADRAEQSRRYRRKNREAISQRRAELRRDKIAREGIDKERLRRRRNSHGADYAEVVAAMWLEQAGRCYLCGDEMNRNQAVIDHDHNCCPPTRSCSACRRGLACHRCNRLIGQFGDDPEQMRRMADNLESRARAARLRIAAKPVQLEMVQTSDLQVTR